MTPGSFSPVHEHNAPSTGEIQGAACECSVKPDNHTNSGALSSLASAPPVRLPPPVRTGNSASEVTAIPASLAAFLHEFIGERAVRRETVKKAAPDSFRVFRDEF